ncbi:MAG: hypothetical protein Q4G43_11230, partial [Mobilicoccus sp.]|nr:hypothetical protein [Mobilicoccus sp.]
REGVLDRGDPDDRALIQLVEADKRLSMLVATPETPTEQAPWVAAVPLVLVTTSYAPHGEHPPIPGRVEWLDPTTPESYLVSLRAVGAYDYWRLEDAAV